MMDLRFQELIIESSPDSRSLTVQLTRFWKCALGIVLAGCVGYSSFHASVGFAIATGVSLLAVLLSFFTLTLVIDSNAKQLILRSGIGPLRGTSTIPFESIKLVTFSDGGVGVHSANGTPQRPNYSFAVEVQGRKQVKVRRLLSGVPADQLVQEAHYLADQCGKPLFIPSVLQ